LEPCRGDIRGSHYIPDFLAPSVISTSASGKQYSIDSSFTVPEPLDLNKLLASEFDKDQTLEDVLEPPSLSLPSLQSPSSVSELNPGIVDISLSSSSHSLELNKPSALDTSHLASAGGEISLLDPPVQSSTQNLSAALNSISRNITSSLYTSSMENGDSTTLTQLGLIHEQRLLEKDRELVRLQQEIKANYKEINALKTDIAKMDTNNNEMTLIVGEFEKTIGQLIQEKERDQVVLEIDKDRLRGERDQVLEDLGAVERAFSDLHKKFERTREVVQGFKSNEDMLKATVEDLNKRYKKSEERYELLKTHAETKLSEANQKLDEIKRSKAGEIAKLQALLRKAEMGVASLERTAEQKTRENEELTKICDELISRVGQ